MQTPRLRRRPDAAAVLALLGLTLAAPVTANAFTVLTEDKTATFTHRAAAGAGTARIRVGADPGLGSIEDPTICPSSSSLRIASYPSATNRVVGAPEAALPCELWRAEPGGWVYEDPAGTVAGVRRIRVSRHGLSVDAGGPGFTPVVGPVGFAELWFQAGAARFVIRFHSFDRNDERAVASRRVGREAAAGERAFWATLGGHGDQSDRALSLLRRAVDRDRRDGRSWFLIGMMHLQRYERLDADPREPGDRGKIEVAASMRALGRAEPLLWDGARGDSRVPGFASAAAYKAGVAFHDAELVARASAAVDRAAAINPLFNSFIPFGRAPIVDSDSDEYAGILYLLDVVFPSIAAECGGQDAICFNGGLAPHNLEGTLLLFGDLYTKGNRPERARSSYLTAAVAGESRGWRPEFVARARALAAAAYDRAALYQDEDPGNDPPFTDLGGAGNCAYCHSF